MPAGQDAIVARCPRHPSREIKSHTTDRTAAVSANRTPMRRVAEFASMPAALPWARHIIHSDLLNRNVLLNGSGISGVIN